MADLEALGLLERIAHDAPEWELAVVGHSLGGSVAALVAWLLQGAHAQPVRCWAIDPVGMTCSPALATRMEPFCISVAYGSSWVPRFTGFLDLRKCAPDSLIRWWCIELHSVHQRSPRQLADSGRALILAGSSVNPQAAASGGDGTGPCTRLEGVHHDADDGAAMLSRSPPRPHGRSPLPRRPRFAGGARFHGKSPRSTPNKRLSRWSRLDVVVLPHCVAALRNSRGGHGGRRTLSARRTREVTAARNKSTKPPGE